MKDKTKLLHERALITCVIMLFLCIILKLFGISWFDLDTYMPILQEIDAVIMNNYWLCTIYSYVLLSINLFFIISITLKLEVKDGIKYTIYFSSSTVFLIVCKMEGWIGDIAAIVDILYLIAVCKMISKHAKMKRILCVIALNIVYQSISLFIRDIGNIYVTDVLRTLLLSLDYYILLLITYMFVMKGSDTNWFSRVSFSSLPSRLWRRHSTVSERFSKSKER